MASTISCLKIQTIGFYRRCDFIAGPPSLVGVDLTTTIFLLLEERVLVTQDVDLFDRWGVCQPEYIFAWERRMKQAEVDTSAVFCS